MHVDIWVKSGGRSLAVELKYKKRAFETVIGNERFKLKNDGAQDLGRYDFSKDVERFERIAAHIPQVEGCAVLLTNDNGYWKDRATTVDAAFRLPEGRNLTGELG